MAQQGDVLLIQAIDDGEIIVENGIVEMSGGLETAAYLSLFGGNEDDDGRDNSPFSWWGNLDEINLSQQYHSETQNLLQAIPASSANLLKVEDAVNRDLSWFLQDNIASSIVAEVSIPTFNVIKIIINIEANGEESNFNFTQNWKITK